MIVIPAVDIKEGRCVRLVQGRRDRETVFSDDPVEMAVRWEQEGAGWLHVVDLDGAFRGAPTNLDVVGRIAESVGVPVQLGGGIRDIASVERVLGVGVRRVVLGTAAYRDPDLVRQACASFPGRVAVGLDVKRGSVAVSGWEQVTERRATEGAAELEGVGVSTLIYTDVERDGMMEGPNLAGLRDLLAVVRVSVIVSGGIESLDSVRAIVALRSDRIAGMIIGRALYEGSISLPEAIALAREGAAC